MGHGVDVGNEEATLERLLCADTDRVALATYRDFTGVVDAEDDGTIVLDVREFLRSIAADVFYETVRGILIGEKIEPTGG